MLPPAGRGPDGLSGAVLQKNGQLPPLQKPKRAVGFTDGSDNEGAPVSLSIAASRGPGQASPGSGTAPRTGAGKLANDANWLND